MVPPATTLTVSESTIATSGDGSGSPAPAKPVDDRTRFVKRPGFWVMIGAVVVVGVGTGVAVALTRKDDAPECGTTGSCATTQGLTLTSF